MLYRMSGQNKINFLEKQDENKEEIKATEEKENTDEVKAKKLSNKDDGYKKSNYIASAVTNTITDIGGPSKYIKSESSNSIWDNNKLDKLAQEIDSKTKTKIEKEQIATNKRNAEKERMDVLAEEVQSNLNKNSSSISKINNFEGSNYKFPTNNMSIFDTKDFQRLAEKTAGEIVKENNKKKREQKDDSWKGNKKATSTRDINWLHLD